MPRTLKDVAIVPVVPEGYDVGLGAIHHPPARRASATRWPKRCRREGIPTAIYYAEAAASSDRLSSLPGCRKMALPVSEQLADEVISLPMHAYLDEPTQDRIIDAIRRALR